VIELDSHDARSYRQAGWTELARQAARFNSIGAALSVGKAHALKVTGANRAIGQHYCCAFSQWAKANGFYSMRASDRFYAIALHENLTAITAWRDALPEHKRRRLIGRLNSPSTSSWPSSSS
jgi:hypothetical protein